MNRLTGGQALARTLARAGVRHVFGVPGVQLDHALDAFATPGAGPQWVSARHEQGAAHLAEGYARVSGTPGVCLVVPGPGMLNALTAVATGYACSSPLVLITADLPRAVRGRRIGLLHEIDDQAALLRSTTKWSATVEHPDELPGLVAEALRRAVAGRPRPVALNVPADLFGASLRAGLLDTIDTVAPGPDDALGQLARPDDALVEALRSARFPVVLAGWGVHAADAGPQVLALAETLGAPVVTSRNGVGAVAPDHPLAMPPLATRPVLKKADLVVAVGTRFVSPGGAQLPLAPGATLVLVNADPVDVGPPRRPDHAVVGDAAVVVAGLVGALQQRPPARDSSWDQAELDAICAGCADAVAAIEPQWSFVQALRAAVPDDGILVNELTQVGYLASVGYPVRAPRALLGAGYQGTLGYGFPTALGAKLAAPDRAVVSINGDGGFGYHLAELATARRYGIGVVAVVFDDSAYGNVRRIQAEEFGGRFVGADLAPIDHVALARAFGVDGYSVGGPEHLADVLRKALAADRPALVHVPVEEMPSVWPLLLGGTPGSVRD